MEQKSCILCEQKASADFDIRTYRLFVKCPNCGPFATDAFLSQEGASKYSKEQRALFSHVIARGKEGRKEAFELTSNVIEEILKVERLPLVNEKIENLILQLGRRSTFFGEKIPKFPPIDLMAKIGAISNAELYSLALAAASQDYITEVPKFLPGGSGGNETFQTVPTALTLKGWQLFEQISQGQGEEMLAFMAMPFRYDYINDAFEKHWKPAAGDAGYRLELITENQTAGVIVENIKGKIRRSKFLVCDLSGGNRGAYWEAGFAEGLGKPIIYLCEKKYIKCIHFDVKHFLYIEWDRKNPAKAAKQLQDVIKETMAQRGQ